jgi:hypothetical protein
MNPAPTPSAGAQPNDDGRVDITATDEAGLFRLRWFTAGCRFGANRRSFGTRLINIA